jgi:DHA2 family multidrug resistance protein
VLARHQQIHQQYLVQNVYGSGAAYMRQAQALKQQLLTHTAASADAQKGALFQIYQTLQAQASVLSYIDILQMLSVFCACMIPLVFLLKKAPKGMEAAVH